MQSIFSINKRKEAYMGPLHYLKNFNECHKELHVRSSSYASNLFIQARGGSRINFRVLQNFTKKIEHRNDVTCRKIIDSARSKKVQF